MATLTKNRLTHPQILQTSLHLHFRYFNNLQYSTSSVIYWQQTDHESAISSSVLFCYYINYSNSEIK